MILPKHSFTWTLVEPMGGNIGKVIIIDELVDKQLYHQSNDQKEYYKDGNWWCYYSAKKLSEKYPYLNENSVKRWLKELEKDGWLKSGVYNKHVYDRTKWYTVDIDRYKKETLGQNDQRPSVKMTNETDQNGRPIPLPPTLPSINNTVRKEVSDDGFEQFWDKYDDKGRSRKKEAKQVWARLSQKDREWILRVVPLYVQSTTTKRKKTGRDFKPMRLHAVRYLRYEVWKEYPLEDLEPVSYTTEQQKQYEEYVKMTSEKYPTLVQMGKILDIAQYTTFISTTYQGIPDRDKPSCLRLAQYFFYNELEKNLKHKGTLMEELERQIENAQQDYLI